MDGSKIIKSTKDITLIAVMTTILFVQEQLLASLPGIQLTVFLIVLFSKKLGLAKCSIIIVLHVLLDNFYMSSFSLIYTPTMLIGWLIIPLSLCTIFKKVESPIILALLGVLYSFIYCWLYIIPSYFLISIDPITYLISDIAFEITLAVVSFVSILFLYRPCSNIFELLKK
jgi:hypothetical protein